MIRLIWRLGPLSISAFVLHKAKIKLFQAKHVVAHKQLIPPYLLEGGELNNECYDDFSYLENIDREILRGQHLSIFSEDTFTGDEYWHTPYYVSCRHTPSLFIPLDEFSGRDVKLVWDKSRFVWLIKLAAAYRITGQRRYLKVANLYLESWFRSNPVEKGINWACAHECSIRFFLLCYARTLSSGKAQSDVAFVSLLKATQKRVSFSILYSDAQANNHTLIENMFLYFAHKWASKTSRVSALKAIFYRAKVGYYLNRLFMNDGGISMYSLNYQRAVLELIAIIYRVCNVYDVEFPEQWRRTVYNAYTFLVCLVDPNSGVLPNIGHNDGSSYIVGDSLSDARLSLLFIASSFGYRAPEYCRGLEKRVFHEKSVEFCTLQYILGNKAGNARRRYSRSGIGELYNFQDFGLIYAKCAWGALFLRYPNYKFRPSQCDPLHLSMVVRGEEVLIDGGTYSYNPEEEEIDDLCSINGHNAPYAKGSCVMRKYSRFLYYDWPKGKAREEVSDTKLTIIASYQDYMGNHYERRLSIMSGSIDIRDNCEGKKLAMIVCGFSFSGSLVEEESGYRHQSGVLFCTQENDNRVETHISSVLYSPWYLRREHCTRVQVSVSAIDSSACLQTKLILGER